MMLFLIVLMAVLISVVYIRRRRMNALAAEAANSVENPVYTGWLVMCLIGSGGRMHVYMGR